MCINKNLDEYFVCLQALGALEWHYDMFAAPAAWPWLGPAHSIVIPGITLLPAGAK